MAPAFGLAGDRLLFRLLLLCFPGRFALEPSRKNRRMIYVRDIWMGVGVFEHGEEGGGAAPAAIDFHVSESAKGSEP